MEQEATLGVRQWSETHTGLLLAAVVAAAAVAAAAAAGHTLRGDADHNLSRL